MYQQMGTHARSPVGGRPLVEHVAGYLADPVLRLRFLRTAAAVSRVRERRWWRGLRRFGLIALAACCAALVVLIPLFLLSRLRATERTLNAPPPTRAHVAAAVPLPNPGAASDVWLVEKSAQSEAYSNGLRIDNRFLAATHARSYLAFPANGGQPVRRSQPAGIVFHTTESRQAPFEATKNRVLRRIGESLLEYVRRRQAYNFVIDRFGRVYRVVSEEEAATGRR